MKRSQRVNPANDSVRLLCFLARPKYYKSRFKALSQGLILSPEERQLLVRWLGSSLKTHIIGVDAVLALSLLSLLLLYNHSFCGVSSGLARCAKQPISPACSFNSRSRRPKNLTLILIHKHLSVLLPQPSNLLLALLAENLIRVELQHLSPQPTLLILRLQLPGSPIPSSTTPLLPKRNR